MHPYDTRRKAEIHPSKRPQPSDGTTTSSDPPASSKRGQELHPFGKKGKGWPSSDETFPTLYRRILPKEPARNGINALHPSPFCGNAASTKLENDGMASDIAVEGAANLGKAYRPNPFEPKGPVLYGTNGLVPGYFP